MRCLQDFARLLATDCAPVTEAALKFGAKLNLADSSATEDLAMPARDVRAHLRRAHTTAGRHRPGL